MSKSNTQTAQWSSQLTFILAAVGCSVGLGNLWRFSAEAGSNGGGAFIVVYIACVLLIGVPALMAELMIGRAGEGASGVFSAQDLSARSNVSKHWSIGVWIGIIAAFLVLSFYGVVAAWVLDYIPRFLTGAFDGQTPEHIALQFSAMTSNPWELMPWYLLFCVLTVFLVARGVNRGIELASKVLMPTFFLLLAGLAIYGALGSMESGGTAEAVSFLFNPDFSQINGKVLVSAMGQAFFSIGIGFAMMVTYGSYLPSNISLPRSALIIGLSDTMVALIAGMAIFPIVFQYNLDFNAGAGLFFQTLPTALISAPGGNYVGAAFFFMGFFAALTTGVAMLEPATAHIAERFSISKAKSAIVVGAIMTITGFASLFSMEVLDFLDVGLTAPIMLPLSGLLVVLFVGWRLDNDIIAAQLKGKDEAFGRILMFLIRFVAPIMIAIIFLVNVRDTYFI